MTKILFCLALLSCLSCKPQPASTLASKVATAPPLPTREELLDRFREERRLLIVYSDELESVAQQIKQRQRRTECQLLPEAEVSRGQLQESPTLLLGAGWSNPAVKELIGRLPFSMEEGVLRVNGYQIQGPNTVFALSFYPNPLVNTLPLALITAFEPTDITRFYQQREEEGLSTYRWADMGYEVYQDGRRLLMGAFDETTWQPDKRTQFDFTEAKDTTINRQHFNFILHQVPPAAAYTQRLIEGCEASAAKVLTFCEQPAPSRPVPCHLYHSLEQKGLRLNNTQPSQADFSRGTAHLVANEIFQGQHAGAENTLLLRQLLGKPQLKALEDGLALYFTTNWQKQGYAYWASRLHQSGNGAPLAEILDNDQLAQASPLVMGCLSASFVDFLITHWGRETFLERYPFWQPAPKEISRLEAAWQEHLSQPQPPRTLPLQGKQPQPQPPRTLPLQGKQPQPQPQPQPPRTLPLQGKQPHPHPHPPLPYLKGFNFAHEGYAIYNGYGSELASQSIHQMERIGANAIAIVPYSYMHDAQAPTPLPLMSRAGSETDEGVIHDNWVAQRLGMKTVLKPQIWLGGGSWPGDVEMENEEDWLQFFDYYYRWMRHYALLAEMNDMNMLCIGVEFAKATLQREEDWRALIRQLRGIYSGPMAYSANWGKEFENLQFWDELDYIGLNCYYPLSQSEDPTDEELNAAFNRVLHLAKRVSQKYDKPLLFTEIGFTSTDTPWINPHKDRDGSPYEGDAQKRCYRIVMENLVNETDWCKGILWWKYPTYLSRGGSGHTGFTPNGKPAQEVVEEWFGRLP